MFDALRNLFGRKRPVEPAVYDGGGFYQVTTPAEVEKYRSAIEFADRIAEPFENRDPVDPLQYCRVRDALIEQAKATQVRHKNLTRHHRSLARAAAKLSNNEFKAVQQAASGTILTPDLIASFQKLADDAGAEGSRNG